MPSIDYSTLKEDDNYYQVIDNDVWLMDNHKWALYIWEDYKNLKSVNKFSLVHIDYHWDGVNDFYNDAIKEAELLSGNLDKVKEFIIEDTWIRFDSFIAPAILRGFIEEVHFYCLQNDGVDMGIDSDTLTKTSTKQTIHENIESIASQSYDSPLIFDFCLDIFNKSDNWYDGNIWNEELIIEFINKCEHLVKKANLVTISLSFGYSGTEDDTKRLAQLIVPKIMEWRQ